MSRQHSLLQSVAAGENRSVSPVIGVILMVAVTVILAAVIGATALGFTDSLTESPPQADLSATQGTTTVDDNIVMSLDYTSVTITHESGEAISKDNIRVTVNGEPAYATLDPAGEFYSDPPGNKDDSDVLSPWDSVDEDTISAGDETIIVLGTSSVQDNNQIPGQNEITFRHQTHPDASGDRTSVVLWGTGSNVNLKKKNVELESGDTVRMIWESGDRSVPLVEHEITQ